MIDLHLVSWNRPKMTELVIRTLYRNTNPGTFTLTVFDNGSDEDTRKMLESIQSEGLIHSLFLDDKNKGLEYARQYMLEHHTYNGVFVDMDNDCLPPPRVDGVDWLTRQKELMYKYPEYGAISQRTQVMIGTGNIFEEADNNEDDLLDFPHPGGSIRLMSTSAVREVHGWTPVVPGRGSEEKKIGSKLRDAGYHTAFAVDITCLHLFGTRDNTNETDRWGYDKAMKPEDTGHSDIWHPALSNGDDFTEVEQYAGRELTEEYFGVNDNHKA